MISLQTPRLILRETMVTDAPAFFDYINQEEYLRFMPFGRSSEEGIAQVLGEEIEANRHEPRPSWRLSILLKEETTLIGDIKVTRDLYKYGGLAKITYGLNAEYWNNGYLTEALIAVTDWAHETLGFHRIKAHCPADNIGSWRSLEKSGYEREGITRYAFYNPRDQTWDKADFIYASVRPEMVEKK